MRYGIFSDVQGNYEALERFFAETKDDIDQYFCLGDIVQNGTSYDDHRCIDAVIKMDAWLSVEITKKRFLPAALILAIK